MRAQGLQVRVMRSTGVMTVPGRGVVPFITYYVETTMRGKLGNEVGYLVDCGRVNANDTINEGAAPESDWALGVRLQVMLDCSRDISPEARAWFAAHGIN
jgi:hypothetical protein